MTIVIFGGGAFALAAAVGYATSYITGDESGTERLTAPVLVDIQGIAVNVTSVVQTPNFTRVSVTITNGLSNTIDLPLFGNCVVSAPGENSLDADAFRSSLSESITPQGTRQGVIVFNGRLSDQATSMSLDFARVYEQGFEGPDSISVPDIRLTAISG